MDIDDKTMEIISKPIHLFKKDDKIEVGITWEGNIDVKLDETRNRIFCQVEINEMKNLLSQIGYELTEK